MQRGSHQLAPDRPGTLVGAFRRAFERDAEVFFHGKIEQSVERLLAQRLGAVAQALSVPPNIMREG